MIYNKISIEPEDGEEFTVSDISVIRTEETNDCGEHKYRYGGYVTFRTGAVKYFNGDVWFKRERVIFGLFSTIFNRIENDMLL